MAGIVPKDILQLNQFVDEHTLLLQNEEKHCFQHNWLPGSYLLGLHAIFLDNTSTAIQPTFKKSERI